MYFFSISNFVGESLHHYPVALFADMWSLAQVNFHAISSLDTMLIVCMCERMWCNAYRPRPFFRLGIQITRSEYGCKSLISSLFDI
jgi:hypothetical protein